MYFDLKNGDCLELMRDIPDGSVDLIVTDPPYGMSLQPQRREAKFHRVKIANDDTLDWCDGFFAECYRVTSKNSASMFFCSHHCVSEFIASAKNTGFEIKTF